MNVNVTFQNTQASYEWPGFTWRLNRVTGSSCEGYTTEVAATSTTPNGFAVTLPSGLAAADHGTTQVAVVTPPTSGDINYYYFLEVWAAIDSGYGDPNYDRWMNSASPFQVLVLDSVDAGMRTRPMRGAVWPRNIR